MFRAALNYPTEGERGAVALLVGSFLTFLLWLGEIVALVAAVLLFDAVDTGQGDPVPSAVVLVTSVAWIGGVRVLLRGYYVSIHRTVASEADPAAPPFRGLRLVTDGVKSGTILVTYLLPAVVFGVVGIVLREGAGIDASGQVVGTVGAVAFLLAILAVIGAAYLVPAAVTLFASEDRFRSAYSLRRVVRGAATETYAVAWVEAAFLQLFLQPIAYLLQFLLVGILVRFYVNVSVRYLFATGFAHSLGVDRDDTAADPNGTTEGANEGEDADADADGGVESDGQSEETGPPTSLAGDAPTHALRPQDRWRQHKPSEDDVDPNADEDDPLAGDFYRRREE